MANIFILIFKTICLLLIYLALDSNDHCRLKKTCLKFQKTNRIRQLPPPLPHLHQGLQVVLDLPRGMQGR